MGSPAKTQNDVALFAAVRNGDIEQARRLLHGGANVGHRGGLFAERPLHVAASKSNHEMVCLLLDHGAAVNATCERGNSALHEAVLANAVDVVRVLCDAGGDVTAKNKTGATPSGLVKRKKGHPTDTQAASDILKLLKYGAGNGDRHDSVPSDAKGSGRARAPPPQQQQQQQPPAARHAVREAPGAASSPTLARKAPQQRTRSTRGAGNAASQAKAYSRWFEGLRSEDGEVRWSAVQDELVFAEELCRVLRAADAMKRSGVVEAAELIPMLMPHVPPAQVATLIPAETTAPHALRQDPVGWVNANFPTKASLRAANLACINSCVAGIVAAKLEAAEGVEAGRVEAGAAPTCDELLMKATPPVLPLVSHSSVGTIKSQKPATGKPSTPLTQSRQRRPAAAATATPNEVELSGASDTDSESVSPPHCPPPPLK